jgi:hypothetical protein
MKHIFLVIAPLLLGLTIGCGRSGTSFSARDSEPLVAEAGEGYLMFDLQPLEIAADHQRFDCTFTAEGKSAHFQFDVTSREASGDPPIAVTSGRIIAVPGSDASVFLHRLQKTLEAKNFPARSARVKELPFTAAILGTTQSHSADGGFFTNPPGNWTAMKIFLGKDGSIEVFLNFNAVLHKGEFSIKDPDYGDDVLRELAKVL